MSFRPANYRDDPESQLVPVGEIAAQSLPLPAPPLGGAGRAAMTA